MDKTVYHISKNFTVLNTGVKSHVKLVYSKGQGKEEKLNTCVKAEVKFVYPKFGFLVG
jgi:hypothetical protein